MVYINIISFFRETNNRLVTCILHYKAKWAKNLSINKQKLGFVELVIQYSADKT
jgi:hypothetical protein